MFFEEKNFDNIIQNNEKRIKEISSQIDSLTSDMEKLYDELSLTPDELSSYINNPENFDKETWQHLQEEREKLELRLRKKLDSIRDPKKSKESFSDRHIPNYAIFCR